MVSCMGAAPCALRSFERAPETPGGRHVPKHSWLSGRTKTKPAPSAAGEGALTAYSRRGRLGGAVRARGGPLLRRRGPARRGLRRAPAPADADGECGLGGRAVLADARGGRRRVVRAGGGALARELRRRP